VFLRGVDLVALPLTPCPEDAADARHEIPPQVKLKREQPIRPIWKYGIAHRRLFEPELGEKAPHRDDVHGGAPGAVSEVT